MQEKNKSKEYCRSCGALLYGKFCSECGEKKFDKKDLTFKKIVLQFIDGLTHFDSKILSSVKLLITKPGLLAKEYCSGARVKYAKPLQLFFIINVIYFIVVSIGSFKTYNTPLQVQMNGMAYSNFAKSMVEHKLETNKISLEQYSEKFDSKVNVLSKSLIIIIVPVLAFILHLLFINKKRTYPENFIFSINFLSWFLIYQCIFEVTVLLLIIIPKAIFNANIQSFFSDDLKSILLFSLMGYYLFRAVLRFYDEKKLAGLLKAIALPFIFTAILFGYRFFLFLITFYST